MISFVGVAEFFFIEGNTNDFGVASAENLISATNIESFPDVYYIILDGYAGSKSLQMLLNYDNSEFIDFLTNKGFYVPSESFSNYKWTRHSIPSTLNMKYINSLAEEKGIDSMNIQKLVEISRDNTVVKILNP